MQVESNLDYSHRNILNQQAQQQEANPEHQSFKQQYFSTKHYLSEGNIFQVILFTWISPLLKFGYRHKLDEKSLPYLKDCDKPSIDFHKLSDKFATQAKLNKSTKLGFTLTKSFLKAFKKQFGFVFLLAFFIAFVQMYTPILSHNVIDYISAGQKTAGENLRYFLSILGISLGLSVCQTWLWYYFAVIGFNLSNTLSLMIYDKALKHPLMTEKKYSIADIVNYSQVDAQRMTNMGFQLVALFCTPFQVAIGLVLLYFYIGVSFLVGLAVMIGLMLVTLVFSKISAKSNDELLQAKDSRMKVTEQILQTIKYIKINALQKYFFKKVNKKREQELKYVKKVNLCNIGNIFLYWLCPPMIVSFTFLVYISIGEQITAAKAFITIIIFNTLQYPMSIFPTAISELIQMWSSIKRVQTFLLASESSKDCVEEIQEDNQNKIAIEIQNGSFLWGAQTQAKQSEDKNEESSQIMQKQKQNQVSKQNRKESVLSQTNQNTRTQQKIQIKQKYVKVLDDLNIKIPARQVTMIIGDIGSGKSSLLYAILNQMTPDPETKPKVKVYGSLAFSPQKAWIMAGTVKENITFFQPYEKKRFDEAITYSCLDDDLKILNKGIETEIGEKGVNLSGGQKARVSLARCLYSDKDIYLLDDILSAVDVHVGKSLMEKTILGYLKGKTVVMPTHAVNYLEYADNVIIMEKGEIVASGTYKEVSKCEEFQYVMEIERKKSQQKYQSSNPQQSIVKKELKMIKQATQSLQKIDSKQQQVTDEIVQQLILPQDQKSGEVSIEVYLQYVKLNGGALFIFGLIFCMSAWTTLAVFSNIQIERWCEDEQKSKKHLYFYLLFSISASLFSGVKAFILITSGVRLGRTVHSKMIKSLLYASITRFYNRVPVGRILNRLSKDLRQIDETVGWSVNDGFECFFSLFAGLVMCVYASTLYVLLPILAVGVACRFMIRYYLRTQRECVRMENVSQSPIVEGFSSAVNGVSTIRAFKLQESLLKLQMEKIELNKRARISRQAMDSWACQRLAFLSFAVNMSALAYCIFSGSDNASLAGLLLTYAGLLSEDFVWCAYYYGIMEIRMISVERVLTFTKIQPEPAYSEYCRVWGTREEGSDLNAVSEGTVQFKNYSARYRDDLPFVIKNISLRIEKGQKIGIVGRTGAGKSTLLNCLLRILEPAEGSILIDGKEIREYRIKDLRSCITMIEQEPTLIKGSFRENLDPANQYTDSEITKILGECNLAEMVFAKGGLDSKITNENLSVGEKQLVCICRALLKNSRIILIDEATANIDVKNDRLIQQVISTAFKNSTVLTIAHRLSTLQNSDKVMVLSEGKVAEWGSVKQLMKKPDGIYRKMCEENDNSYLL